MLKTKTWMVTIILIITLMGLSIFIINERITERRMPEFTDSSNKENLNSTFDEMPLPIPPLLEDENPDPNRAEFSLTAQKSSMEFFKGKQTETYGYNGDYLGPVIRVKRGEDVSIKIKNELDEKSNQYSRAVD